MSRHSRHYGKAPIIPDLSQIGRKEPPTIKFNPPPPPTMKELSLKFALSCNSYQQYLDELELERQGLNLVSVSTTDSETGEEYNQVMTQRELDARIAFSQLSPHFLDERPLPTYDELLIDSDEEETDNDPDEWQKA